MNKGTGIVIGLIAIIAVAFGIYMVDFDMEGGALPDVEVPTVDVTPPGDDS